MTRTAIILAAVLLLTLCLLVWREIHHSTRYALEVERCKTERDIVRLAAQKSTDSALYEGARWRQMALEALWSIDSLKQITPTQHTTNALRYLDGADVDSLRVILLRPVD